jgi:hypothetical protein
MEHDMRRDNIGILIDMYIDRSADMKYGFRDIDTP